MNTGKVLQQLKCTIYGGGSELLDANEASARGPIEMRACRGHQDARISIGPRALSSVSQTNFPHLDFSLSQLAAGNLSIFAACNRKISRNFKCTNCHPENCSTAVTQQGIQPPSILVPVLNEYWSKTGIRKKYPSLKNCFGLHPHEGVPLGPLEAFLGQNIIFGSIAAVLNTVCWELRTTTVVVK